MNFAWAVTDQTHTPKRDTDVFKGYFTDIRRAARKSLPRQPSKDLCGLLGLKSATMDSEKEGSFQTIPIQDIQSRDQDVIQTTIRKPDVEAEKQSLLDKSLSILPCSESLENCTKRERTILAVTIYLALLVIILLIIVVILSATLSAGSHDDTGGSSAPVGPPEPLVSQTSAHTQPSITSTSASTITTRSPSSSAAVSSTPLSTNPPTSSSAPQQSTTLLVSTPLATSSIRRSSLTTPIPTQSSSSRSSKDTTQETTQALTTSTSSSTSPVFSQSTLATSTTTTTTTNTTTTTTAIPFSKTSSKSSPTLSVSTVSPEASTKVITTSATVLSSTNSSSVLFPKLAPQTVSEGCLTGDCLSTKETTSKVDFNTSPCQDFYQFSCGGYIRSRKDYVLNEPNGPKTTQADLRRTLLMQVSDLLSVSYSSSDSFAEKVAKRMYQSCLESNQNQNEAEALEELHRAVDVLGMTPVGNIVNTVANLLSTVKSLFGATPFFRAELAPISTGGGNSVYGLKVSPPDLTLDRNIYRRPLESNEIAGEYVDAVTAMLYAYVTSFPYDDTMIRKRRSARYRRQFTTGNQTSYAQLYERVARAYQLEVNISKIIQEVLDDGVQIEIITDTRIPVLLDSSFNIPWDLALGVSDSRIGVRLVYPDFFQKLDDLLGQTAEDDVMMYIFMTTMAQRIWQYMPLGLRQILRYSDSHVQVEYADCVKSSLELAKEEIHGIYIGRFIQQVLDDRIQLTHLYNLISVSFQDIVSATSWMHLGLKTVVSVLMANMRVQFSTVSYDITSSSGIIGENQTFLTLALELHAQMNAVKLGKLRSNVTAENSLDWTSTSAVYDAESNTLGLPTALGVYFINGPEPPFKVYGQIGKVIADQMIKVLTGELTRGMAPAWWGSDNIAAFNDVTSCFSDQQSSLQMSYYEYSKMMLANGGLQLIKKVFYSSNNSVSELIPGTILTREMLFYLNAVQEMTQHCPVLQIKIIVTLTILH